MTPLALVYVATCGRICFLRSSTVLSVASDPSTSEMLPKISVFCSVWDSKRKKKNSQIHFPINVLYKHVSFWYSRDANLLFGGS